MNVHCLGTALKKKVRVRSGNGQLCLCRNWGSEAARMAYFTAYMLCPKHDMLNKHRTYVRAGAGHDQIASTC